MSEPTRAAGMDAMAAARHEWMDYAKGICIVAVVTLYTTNHVQPVLGSAPWMQWWVEFAHPFRMPDFFFISGLLLGRVIDRPWRSYADKKLVHYLYFFVVWTLIYFVARVAIGHVRGSGTDLWREFVKVSTHGPFAMLWFIQMLPFYFLLTRLLRRVPWPLVLPLAVLWYLAPIDTPWMQVDRAGDRFVFFYAGYVFAAQAFAFARWVGRNAALALPGLAAWALLNGALVFSGAAQYGGVSLSLGMLGAFAVIAVAALLHARGWAGWLRYCGEHSLPIYLGFFIPMSALMSAALALQRHTGLPLDPGLLALLLAAASIVVALAAWRAARRTPLAFLYERPGWTQPRQSDAAPAHGPAAASSAPVSPAQLTGSPASSRR
jgi:uncharacterized membrane protein YcfT